MTIQSIENRRQFSTCASYRDAVRGETDRVVVFNPDWPPSGFVGEFTAEIRAGLVGPVPARVVSDDRTEVEVYFDQGDMAARGLDRHPAHHASTLRVEVANLLKASVTSAIALREEQQVAYAADHHGFPGTFDLLVTLRADANLYTMLPAAYVERHDPQMAEPNFTFKAAARPLGDGVYELWLLMGGRGGSATVELEEQYLLGRGGDEGPAFAWPIYAAYTGTMPTEPEVKLGEVYNVRLGEQALVLGEAEAAGRFHVARVDREGVPVYSTVPREDLIPLTDRQRAQQQDDWHEAAFAIAVHQRRQRTEAERRASEAVSRARIAREHHEADIETISERFIQEANDRDWCSEYDRIIDEINSNLNVEMRERKRDYEVRVRVTYYTTVTVEARDRDAAESMVEDDRSLVMDDLDTDDPDSITVTGVDEA